MARSFCRRPDMKSLKLHEDESVRIATAILGDVEFDAGRTGEILEIIDGHDTRAEALSLNDKIVKDSRQAHPIRERLLVSENVFFNPSVVPQARA